METQFTPAPWTAHHAGRFIEVTAAEGHVRPVVKWVGFAKSDRPLAEQVANAFLIAAAPELFAFTAMIADRDDDSSARELIAKVSA